MLKIIGLVARQPHLDRAAFRERYETQHAPLVAATLPIIRRHQRNYPDPTQGRFHGGESDCPFDSITQAWLADGATAEDLRRALADADQVRRSAGGFVDTARSMWFPVEEHNNTTEPAAGAFKVIALLPRLPHVTREQFKAYYEAHHAPLAARLIQVPRRAQRNYPITEQACLPPGVADAPFDSITQSWYDDRAGFERYLEVTRAPDVVAQISQDESHFLDRSRAMLFRADECETREPQPLRRMS